jgi:methanogenic corrinoid protein MtbC1
MIEIIQISEALTKMDYAGLGRLIESALAEGQKAETTLKEALVKGMEEVGERFKEGELFNPEVLVWCYNIGFTMSDLFKDCISVFNPMVLDAIGALAYPDNCKGITLTLH